ncbi:MAG: PASTA domain-containing protein [Methanoregulaceae archaeon]|nr:PASTA domain-containing protein [Methanoregulaceae archaeon]
MIGTVLRGRYELAIDQGESPLFHSFAARDRLHGRDVGIRLIREPYAREQDFIAKLREVASNLAGVQSVGLERLFGVDEAADAPFLVSELAKGTPLLERLRKLGTFSVPVAVELSIAVAEALQTLHGAGFVHGDVGSHTVVTGPEGEVKLQMAGVWQAYSSSGTAGMAMLPVMAPYLAPEIASGGMPSPASDVYAAGVLLYEMLSGRYPFYAETPVAMALKHSTDAVPNVRMMNPSVPVALAEIIKKAMAKSPLDRYRDAGDLLSDLRILQDALRFGRTLTWPIREESKPTPPPPVAPKMSAIRQDAKEEEDYEEPESGDIPGWFKSLIAFFAGLLVLMVIAWMVFNLKKPATVQVPDLTRLSVTESLSRLEGMGLKLRIGRRMSNEQIPKDQVLDQNPPANEKVYEGSSVSVTVSMGSKFVDVPDVRGLTVDQAKTMLGSLDLGLEPDVEMVRDSEAKPGTILSQEPMPKQKLQRLGKLRVKVATDKETPEEAKDARTKYQYTIRVPLTGLETRIRLRVDLTDARGTRTIHEQEHDPESVVEVMAEGYGKTALFRIYYDDELVAEKSVEAEQAVEETNE